MRKSVANRVGLMLVLAGAVLLWLNPRVVAQDDADKIPLGDVARSLGNRPPLTETVIDNDNISQVMQEAESRHETGLSALFSLEPPTGNVHVPSPDVMCSLSFTAKSSSFSDQMMLSELPRSEMDKLQGPAAIDGDSLQISLHNGSSWELREVLVGVTIVTKHAAEISDSYSSGSTGAKMLPAMVNQVEPAPAPTQKQPDVTLLLKLKGTAEPSGTAIFRTALNFELFPDQEWHWAIVKAKGIPPQADSSAITEAIQNGGSLASGVAGSSLGTISSTVPTNTISGAPVPAPSAPSAADIAAH